MIVYYYFFKNYVVNENLFLEQNHKTWAESLFVVEQRSCWKIISDLPKDYCSAQWCLITIKNLY